MRVDQESEAIKLVVGNTFALIRGCKFLFKFNLRSLLTHYKMPVNMHDEWSRLMGCLLDGHNRAPSVTSSDSSSVVAHY